VDEVRKALIIGGLWDAMKSRIFEEEPLLRAQAQEMNEVHETAEIAITLVNMWNNVPEVIADESHPQIPWEEPVRAQREENDRRPGREDPLNGRTTAPNHN
jgi:hypothetical protein